MQTIEDQLQIKINIFSFFDDQGLARYPYYISKKEYEKEVDLLYWGEHYALIKNFSAFLQDHTHENTGHAMHYCKKCFTPHKTEETLKHHNLYCKRIDYCNQIFILPPEGTKLKFKNYKFQQDCPFCIYADFECLTEPINKEKQATTYYQEHKPCSFA